MFFSLSSTRRIFLRSRCGLRGQGEHERASSPELALDPDPASVELDEPLREREAEPGSLALLDSRLGLLELLEDALVILDRDARPGVGNARRGSRR